MDDNEISITPIIEEHAMRISELEARITSMLALSDSKKTATPRTEREKVRYHQKRGEINAKRRAAYKAKKAASSATATGTS